MAKHPDRFFLSALSRSAHNLQSPNPGRWKEDRRFLERYSAAIQIGGDLEDRQVPTSVPSAFARPIQFFQALSRDDHPTHRSILEQWRGLMAAIALRNQFGLPLRAEPFAVQKPAGGGLEAIRAGSQGVGDLHLRTMLWNQLPQPIELWSRWWMIYCDDQLVGATTPWSVVYTPANYRCPALIPWQEGGRFADPIHHLDPGFTGHSAELAILARWIDLMLTGQQDWGFKDDSKSQVVAKLLRDWAADLIRYRSDSVKVSQLNGDSFRVRNSPYHHFLQGPDLEGNLDHGSDFELVKPDGDKALVLTRQDLDPAARVYGPILVGHVDRSSQGLPGSVGEKGWKSRTEKKIDLPYVIAEEAFFPNKLVALKLRSGALQRGSDEFALPLTPKFFEYFPLENFRENKRMLEVNNAKKQVIVQLRLPLGNGQDLQVEKIYDRENDIFDFVGGVPAAAFWPDFVMSDWHENFAFYRPTQGSNLAAAPLLATGEVGVKNDWRADKPLHIWHDNEPAIGFVLYGRDEDTSRHEEVGILVREVRTYPAPPDRERSWHVAVDFGTSSTHVMYAENGSREVRPLPLEGRMVLLTDAEEGAQQEVISALYPDERSYPPFVTVLYESAVTLLSRDTTRFIPRFRFQTNQIQMEDRIVADVKWDHGAGGTQQDLPLRDYLRGLLRYIVAEARAAGAGKVNIEWSYPLALPLKARRHMGQFWKSSGRSFATGVEVTASPNGCSESEAVCRYLAALEGTLFTARSNALSIAVDVGGGSSDAAFWVKGGLVGQVSLKVAGNDILVHMCRFDEFLETLYEKCTGQPLTHSHRLKAFQDQPAIAINSLLTQAIDKSGKPVDPADPSRHPMAAAILEGGVDSAESPWLYVRSLSYLFFMGLAFHLGLLARKHVPTIRQVNLYFGGRGSSLLSWIGDGEQVGQLLSQAFRTGLIRDKQGNSDVRTSLLGSAIRTDPNFQPKEETVRGLLAPPIMGAIHIDPEDPLSLSSTYLGEVGWTNESGTEIGWDDQIDATKLLSLRPPPNHYSSYVAQFLESVLPLGYEELHLDEARLGNLDLRMDKIQDELIRVATSEDAVLQSVFACELKALIEDYTRKVLSDEGVA